MSIALKPKEETNKYISPIFNLNNFYKSNDYASKSDLLSYANLYTANFFQYLNTFANGLNFYGSINGIAKNVFDLVAYLPNIISDIRNISYDEINYSTIITGSSWFETSSINTNLNVGSSLNVDTILPQKMLSNTIQVNYLNCKKRN
jgi:hypothetical protein